MQSTKRVTLLDVAVRAGVSTTTASYILNDRSAQMRISPDTERRVREAVADLGYRPNRSARTLRTANTATIGLVSDFLAGGHYASQMLLGASAAAREVDHLLMIGETDGDLDVEALYIEELLDRQVDGIIYATRTASRIRVPESLRPRRTVLLNCFDPTADLPAVLPDEVAGGRLAARLLVDHGIGDGVYVVGEDPTPHAIAGPERLTGIHEALGDAGQVLAGVVECEWSVQGAFAAVSRWLAAGAEPRGLICLNDRVTMGAYQALAERGLDRARGRRGGLLRRVRARHLAAPAGRVRGAAVRRARGASGPAADRCRAHRAHRHPGRDDGAGRGVAAGPDLVRPPSTHLSRVATVRRVTSLRIVRHVPAGEGKHLSWQQ